MNVYKLLFRKIEGKRPLERSMPTYKLKIGKLFGKLWTGFIQLRI